MRFSILLACMSVLAACSDSSISKTGTSETIDAIDTDATDTTEVTAVVIEPIVDDRGPERSSAAISFEHNYDGATEVNEVESFVLTVVPKYREGTLLISLIEQDGFDLLVESEFSFAMTGEAIEIPVQFRVSEPGSHHFKVVAGVSDTLLGVSRTTWGLSIDVGDDALTAISSQSESQKATDSQADVPDEKGVVVMQAEEVVRQ